MAGVTATSRAKKKETAEAALQEAVEAANRADRVAERKRKAKYRAMKRAHEAGMLYRDIAKIVGVTETRVSQIFAALKKEDDSQ